MYVIFEMFKQDLNQSMSKFPTLKQTFPIQLLESIIPFITHNEVSFCISHLFSSETSNCATQILLVSRKAWS
jgi:hypothetical protein